jgi:hypothetical protein
MHLIFSIHGPASFIVITMNEAHAKSIRYRIVALPATIPFTITSMRDPVSVEFPAPESK